MSGRDDGLIPGILIGCVATVVVYSMLLTVQDDSMANCILRYDRTAAGYEFCTAAYDGEVWRQVAIASARPARPEEPTQ